MSPSEWLVAGAVAVLVLYALLVLVLGLAVAGQRTHARALAGFLPDCLVLLRRLAADPRVPRRAKLALAMAAGYVAFPIDLVPDFIPVAGQLDDAIVVALALRVVIRAGGPVLVEEHWPGPSPSLKLVLRLAAR